MRDMIRRKIMINHSWTIVPHVLQSQSVLYKSINTSVRMPAKWWHGFFQLNKCPHLRLLIETINN